MERIYLTIETNSRSMSIIQIPFLKLRYLDEFTIMFQNQEELKDALFSLLDMPVDKYEIDRIHVDYAKDETRELRELPIKYSVDDYDVESLKRAYVRFFDDDHNRVGNKKYGLIFVGHEAIWLSVNDVRDINLVEIKKAVDAYLSKGYMNKRNAYFILKENRYNVKTRQEIETEKLKNQRNTDTKVADKLLTIEPQNDYFAHLKDYAIRGEEEYAKAMEILAGYDLEELGRDMIGSNGGIIDGIGKLENSDNDLLATAELFLISSTGYSTHELNQIISGNGYKRPMGDERSRRR